MGLIQHILGGAGIILIATLIGIGQNMFRSKPLPLIPKMTGTPPTRNVEGKAAPPPEPRSIDERAADTEDRTEGVVHSAPETALTEEELLSGELQKERVLALKGAGAVIIIDARSVAEYAKGHIPGALNIPYEKFIQYYDRLLEEVPMNTTVICYCQSVTCDLSDHLAREMKLMGYERVVLYRGGWNEWKAAGYPSETHTRGQ